MPINWDKPVQTRDGCEVTIYTAGAKVGRYPVRVEYKTGDVWRTGSWTIKGKWVATIDRKDSEDLVNVPQQHIVWVNFNRLFDDSVVVTRSYQSRAEADDASVGCRVACIEVTFTEGERLECPHRSA